MEAIFDKLISNLIYTPFLALFFGPIKRKVNSFLKKIWPWYINSIYKSASANNTSRPAIFSVILLVAIVFLMSEITLLSIYQPSIPIIDNAIAAHETQSDKLLLTTVFLINIILFVLVMRIEIVHSTIAKFNQMLTIIRPNIEPKSYYELKQKWALMESANDYKKIIQDLFSNNKTLVDNKDKFPEEIKIYNKLKQN